MFEGHHKESVFIFEWTKLPKDMKEQIQERTGHRFNNDIFLKFHSEFEPDGEEQTDWSQSLTTEQLHQYHKDQVETNSYVGDLDQFVKDYGLEFEVWMLGQKIDLLGVTTVLIEVCW